MDSKPRKGSAVSTAVFVIIGAVVVGAAISLYLWSRWSEREADYEPEQLSEEEAAIYQLGTHLGWDGNIAGATGHRAHPARHGPHLERSSGEGPEIRRRTA
jgi:hypothetical protein